MGLSNEQLIAMIEAPSDDFTSAAKAAAQEELAHRGLTAADMNALAKKHQAAQILAYLQQFNVLTDQLELPESQLMSSDEVTELFKETFHAWKAENDDMIPDSWKYVIGAAFG